MANQIDNRLIVVGLKENPEDFARELETQMYGRAVPHESGNLFVEVVNGNFDFTTKWAPKVDAVIELSEKRKDYVFLLSYGGFETQRNGQIVIRNGDVLESIQRIGYSGLFDEIEHPTVDLFQPYLGTHTLAECAESRLQDAIGIVRGLIKLMDDERFKNSPCTPFSDVRNRKKTEIVRKDLAALLDSMVSQVGQIDFESVLLDEAEMREGMVRNAKLAGDLMTSLGVDYLVPGPTLSVRFAILPHTAAIIQDPYRVVLPVLHYANADPVSGQYQKGADGSTPPIAWELRYVCLRPSEVKHISRLPDENQTPYDIDIIMTHAGDRAFGYELYRASNKARWKSDPEIAQEVETKAAKMSAIFAAKVTGKPGMTIFADFRAVDAALFPKTVKELIR